MKTHIAFLLCYLVMCAHSCSMLTHIEIATRAQAYYSFNGFEQFQGIIQKHLSTFQAGATFPDCMYPRNGYHQASEIAHWPPFYLAAAEYIQKTYKQPWTEDAERLVAFLAGAASHMVADVAWHSLLNVTEGFIVSMACFGWECDYDAAHPVADLGGDTVLAVQNDLSYVLKNWSIPIRDISKIYHMQGWSNVTEEVLTESMTEIYVGTMALLEGGAVLLYPKYNRIPGFLQDQFEDYFIGGLDDMAVWTTYCWPYVMSWFVNGPGPTPTICKLMLPAMPTDLPQNTSRVPEWRFTRFPAELDEEMAVVLKELETSAQDSHVELAWSGRPTTPNTDSASSQAEKTTTLYSQIDYAYLGYDIVTADLNGDKLTDLIVSAPGYSNATLGKPQMGCVYFVFGSSALSLPQFVDIETVADYKICGENAHNRFGHAVSVIDFNKDGIIDVAISSPTTNSMEMSYNGEINIFFGFANGSVWYITPEVNMSLVGNYYNNFGSTVTTGDVNSDGYADLIVGCPFAPQQSWNETGFVAIYFATITNVPGKVLSIAQANVFLNAPSQNGKGIADHGWWGSALQYVPAMNNGSAYLIVGGAGNVWLNKTYYLYESGSVSIYLLDAQHFNRPVAVFYGSEFSQLGAQLAIGFMPDLDKTGPILTISMPLIDTTVNQGGNVVFLSFKAVLKWIAAWSANSTDWVLPFDLLTPLTLTTINGNQVYARFGSSLSFVSLVEDNQPPKDTMFVGYPLWSFNTSEAGCVCMWESGYFPRGHVYDPILSAKRVFTSPAAPDLTMKKDARFGNAMGFGDMDGDGNTDIFIGATRKSLNSYLGGAVEIIFS